LAVTTIYVTHDQIEAMTLADRVVIMKAGVVQQVGTPLRFMTIPRMHLLPASSAIRR
jgi:multiple sugar transport system ATP-binding protein